MAEFDNLSPEEARRRIANLYHTYGRDRNALPAKQKFLLFEYEQAYFANGNHFKESPLSIQTTETRPSVPFDWEYVAVSWIDKVMFANRTTDDSEVSSVERLKKHIILQKCYVLNYFRGFILTYFRVHKTPKGATFRLLSKRAPNVFTVVV